MDLSASEATPCFLVVTAADVVGLGLTNILKDHLGGAQVVRVAHWRDIAQMRTLHEIVYGRRPLTGVLGDYPLEGEEARSIRLLSRKLRIPFWLFFDDSSSTEVKWVAIERMANTFRLPLGTRQEQIVELLHSQRLALDHHHATRIDESNWPLLTRKEWQVFHLLGAGKSAKQIALLLGNAVPTIRNHLNSIYRKINAKNKRAAIKIYYR